VRSVTTPSRVLSTVKGPYAFGSVTFVPPRTPSMGDHYCPNITDPSLTWARICASTCSGRVANLCRAQRIPRRSAQAEIQINRLSVLSAFSKWRLQGVSLPPDLLVYGRLDVSIPAISPLPHVPRSLPSSAFRPGYPPLSGHDPLVRFRPPNRRFIPYLFRTPIRHASYAYLHSPYKTHGGHFVYHSS
jgi:hypothetical protein